MIHLCNREEWGGRSVPFFLTREALDRHVFILGKTGTGKSTLLRSIFSGLAESGQGVGLIDPHGQLASDALGALPRRLANRVTYLNANDFSHPPAWNVFACGPCEEFPQRCAGIVSAFKNIWHRSWGPRMEYILTCAVQACLEADHATLLSSLRMLSDDGYRRWIARQTRDPLVRDFWLREFPSYDARFRREAVSPIQNKIGALLINPIIRNILGQERRRLDLAACMDRSEIFVASLAKGAMGEEPSHLLGSLLVSEFQRLAFGRALVPDNDHRPFTLIIDEFHNFGTEAFASLLSEGRKFGISLVLASQLSDSIEPAVRSAIFGNAGTIAAFQVGYDDAERLSNHFGGSFSPGQFTDLRQFELIVKPHSPTMDFFPFRGRTNLPDARAKNATDSIIQRSRQRISTDREKVESRINRWIGRTNW